MKKVIPLIFTAALLLWGCSESKPSITDVSISDYDPVTGQRILLEVNALSDNYPMRYTWQAEAGTFEVNDDSEKFEYWRTPQTPGSYNVYCMVTDDAENTETYIFSITVHPRSIMELNEGEPVLSIVKDTSSEIGGIYFSTQEGQIRYANSTLDLNTVWTGAFSGMYIGVNDDNSLNVWGASASSGEIITILYYSGAQVVSSTISTPGTPGSGEDINTLLYEYSTLWVASDWGAYYYFPSSDAWNSYDFISGTSTGRTNDIFLSKFSLDTNYDYVYLATTSGVYEVDMYSTTEPVPSDDKVPLSSGNTLSVAAVVGDDKTTPAQEDSDTTTLWYVTSTNIYKNQKASATHDNTLWTDIAVDQPASIEPSLDVDINGNVWCGKYKWDGSAWTVTPGLEGYSISKVIASYEGYVYFLTTSGTLLRY